MHLIAPISVVAIASSCCGYCTSSPPTQLVWLLTLTSGAIAVVIAPSWWGYCCGYCLVWPVTLAENTSAAFLGEMTIIIVHLYS